MAPNVSTSSSSSMDPLMATTKVAKAILNAPTGNGKLVATILSAYDLPDDEVPTAVTMSYSEGNGRGGYNEISTGPPAAKHRDHANSFKFGGANGGGSPKSSNDIANQLVLTAPLSTLFESTVTFTLTYANPAKNLTSTCTIHRTLRVNDTQWLILNLDSETGSSTSKGRQGNMASNNSSSSLSDQGPTLRLKLCL